ncbi:MULTISPECIES: hypothetical protein [unclassified Streptomyces]|uniref:hypothetical protein n=1 Tax=unclassified Streptomyces TaxID=2593676 RepID=UPI002DD80A68|nr:hypothetical protein [Streptomyces sp. NBC_01788]WSB25169.1 hypothetical protein OIE49_04310 [Streptomyces sp. NBC_01788]
MVRYVWDFQVGGRDLAGLLGGTVASCVAYYAERFLERHHVDHEPLCATTDFRG